MSHAVTIAGVTYPSVAAAYRAVSPPGITCKTVRQRLKDGWSPEEAFLSINQCCDPTTVDGVTYPSITAALKRYGVSVGGYTGRIDRGWSQEDAIKTPTPDRPWPKPGRTVVINGVTYPSLAQACREVGEVGYTTTAGRIKDGWDVERAVLTPLRVAPRGKRIEIDGIVYVSTAAAIESVGEVAQATVYRRVRAGWDVVDAITTPPRNSRG